MATSNFYINDLISYFTGYDFDEEKLFIEEQQKAGITVCANVLTEDNREAINIVSKLSSNSEEFCNEICGEKCSRQCSVHDSEYYIKSTEVSAGDGSIPSITAVVGKINSDLEAVYEASLFHQRDGRKLVLHASFARQANTLQYSSSLNKADTLKKQSDVSRADSLKSQMKTSKKSKKSKKKKDDLKEIDDIAKNYINPSDTTPAKISVEKTKRSKERSKIFHSKKDLPFKSHEIGQKAGPIKDIFKSSKDRSKSVSEFPSKSTESKNVIKLVEVNHGKNNEMCTTIDNSKEPELYNALKSCQKLNQSHDAKSIPEIREPHLPTTSSSIESQRVMKTQSIARGPRNSLPVVMCSCKEDRLKIISQIITCISKRQDVKDYKQKLDQFSPETYHRPGCPFADFKIPQTRRPSVSHDSLHSHCGSCVSLDDQISPMLRKSIQSLIDEPGECEEEEIILSKMDIDCFMKVLCYEHFDKHILKMIGTRPTPYNFSRLLLIARQIVRHLGNPKDQSNRRINDIYQFVVIYYGSHFFHHIKDNHSGLEDFLCTCQCDSFSDVE